MEIRLEELVKIYFFYLKGDNISAKHMKDTVNC